MPGSLLLLTNICCRAEGAGATSSRKSTSSYCWMDIALSRLREKCREPRRAEFRSGRGREDRAAPPTTAPFGLTEGSRGPRRAPVPRSSPPLRPQTTSWPRRLRPFLTLACVGGEGRLVVWVCRTLHGSKIAPPNTARRNSIFQTRGFGSACCHRRPTPRPCAGDTGGTPRLVEPRSCPRAFLRAIHISATVPEPAGAAVDDVQCWWSAVHGSVPCKVASEKIRTSPASSAGCCTYCASSSSARSASAGGIGKFDLWLPGTAQKPRARRRRRELQAHRQELVAHLAASTRTSRARPVRLLPSRRRRGACGPRHLFPSPARGASGSGEPAPRGPSWRRLISGAQACSGTVL